MQKLVTILLVGYIVIFPFNGLLVLPVTGDKLQIPEFFAIFLFVTVAICFFKYRWWQGLRLIALDKALLLYFAAMVLTGILHPTRVSFFEVLGWVYLLSLYAVINLYGLKIAKTGKEVLHFFSKNYFFTGLVSAILGLVGVILVQIGQPSQRLSLFFPHLPYFGDIYRTKALCTEPIMLNSILCLAWLVLFAKGLSNQFRYSVVEKIGLVLLPFVCYTTVTKSSLLWLIAASWLFFEFYLKDNLKNKFPKVTILKKPLQIMVILGVIIFVYMSHFIMVSKEEFYGNRETKDYYYYCMGNSPVLTLGENTYIVPTIYAFLKRTSYESFKSNPLTGVGGGNATAKVDDYKKQGIYPTYMNSLDPLSTYMGTLAELGIVGFLALLFLYYTIYRSWQQCIDWAKDVEEKIFLQCFSGLFIFMIGEGFTTDTMNFRQYWLIIAFLAAYQRKLGVFTLLQNINTIK